MGKIFRIVFFSAFTLIGISALLYSLWSIHMANMAKSWPSTTGTILKAYCYSSHGSRTTTSTRHVWYQYQIDGKTYKSDREYFGIRVSSHTCVAGYTKGQIVNIYYDPTDPSNAVLVPDAYSSANFGLVVGLAFIGFAGIGFWQSKRNKAI